MLAARKSFTLIEVLIVMFIIAGLVALLLPALHTAKGKAQQARCMNNLHQIHLGLELYAEDHSSQYPLTGNVYHWGETNGWCERIYPYTKSQVVFRCPGQPKEIENDYSYFLNCYSAFTNTGGVLFTREHVKLPSGFILAGDSTFPFPDLTDTDKDNKTQDCLFTWSAQKAMAAKYHAAQVCILFADGHIAVAPQFRPDVMTYSFTDMGVDFALPDPGP